MIGTFRCIFAPIFRFVSLRMDGAQGKRTNDRDDSREDLAKRSLQWMSFQGFKVFLKGTRAIKPQRSITE